jgi:pSer/pThr/pTyr-binding forkhead associated (FHA) protein
VPRFGYAFCAQVTAIGRAEPTRAALWDLTWSRGRIPLTDGQHLIGRGDDTEVRLDSPRVSRLHARVTVSEDGLTYEDLDSKNGTFDDGRPIQGVVPVDDGQTLVIGDVEVAFRRRRRESTATMAAASIKRPGAPAGRSLKKP